MTILGDIAAKAPHYQVGFQLGHAGRVDVANPHTIHTNDFTQWEWGYSAGRKQHAMDAQDASERRREATQSKPADVGDPASLALALAMQAGLHEFGMWAIGRSHLGDLQWKLKIAEITRRMLSIGSVGDQPPAPRERPDRDRPASDEADRFVAAIKWALSAPAYDLTDESIEAKALELSRQEALA